MATITHLEQNGVINDVTVPLGGSADFNIIGTDLTETGLQFYVASKSDGSGATESLTIKIIDNGTTSPTKLPMTVESNFVSLKKHWVAIKDSKGNLADSQDSIGTI